MSFVDMGLKVEFNALLSDYRSCLGNCQQLNHDASRLFDQDPVGYIRSSHPKEVDQAAFSLYLARSNLFSFFMAHLDAFEFHEVDPEGSS